ncbi:MAG: hypothetical protein ACPGPS_04120, partial [Rubripirellula sp.]
STQGFEARNQLADSATHHTPTNPTPTDPALNCLEASRNGESSALQIPVCAAHAHSTPIQVKERDTTLTVCVLCCRLTFSEYGSRTHSLYVDLVTFAVLARQE